MPKSSVLQGIHIMLDKWRTHLSPGQHSILNDNSFIMFFRLFKMFFDIFFPAGDPIQPDVVPEFRKVGFGNKLQLYSCKTAGVAGILITRSWKKL